MRDGTPRQAGTDRTTTASAGYRAHRTPTSGLQLNCRSIKLRAMPTRRPRPEVPVARRRGRPSAANAGPDVRERLLDAAIHLFSENGIAATPLSGVARHAHVTP